MKFKEKLVSTAREVCGNILVDIRKKQTHWGNEQIKSQVAKKMKYGTNILHNEQ